MRVLIGCEFSGTVRDAFRGLGHDAMSCDLLPTETPGPHYVGDVRDLLGESWDLAVFHPPCTYLTNAGVRWLYEVPLRWQDMIDGAIFFRDLLNAPIPRVAVENPVMHNYAARIIGQRQTQVVQPWMFGHEESKGTGLWLRGLPPLVATEDVLAAMHARPKREWARVHHAPASKDRWKKRSVTLPGIAAAMAMQWAGPAEERAA